MMEMDELITPGDKEVSGLGKMEELITPGDKEVIGLGKMEELITPVDKEVIGLGKVKELITLVDKEVIGLGKVKELIILANKEVIRLGKTDIKNYKGDYPDDELFGNGKASQQERSFGDGGPPGDRAEASKEPGRDDYLNRGVPRGYGEEGDGLKATTIVLPTLEAVGVDSGLQVGDWLAQVRPLLGDLATHSLGWWDSMVDEVMSKYKIWLSASPLQRLKVAVPEEAVYNTSAARQRMDLRASGLLMQALPSTLREELIASRCLTSGKILFRILQNYQPGGTSERTNTLRELSINVAATDPRDAVTKLRRWRRHQQRAEELQVTQPDGTLMVRSLATWFPMCW